MVRIGIIGAGTMGNAHAQSILRMPEVELKAVADPNQEKANALAKPAEASAYSTVNELMDRDDIDAVIVASPTPFHFFHARDAIEKQKHVFLEIPMVRHKDEADKLVELSQKSDRVITVGHTQRFYRETQAIKQQVDSGAVGNPGMIRLGRRTPHPKKWYSNFESSGGVILDAMIHELDFLLHCFGPAERIFCQSLFQRVSTESIDYALANIRLKSGAIAHIESSWCHYGQFNIDVEVAGDKGLLHYDNQESIPLKVSLVDYSKGARQYYHESPVIVPACFNLLQQFIHAIEGKAENPVSVEEGRDAAILALAAIDSVNTKRPVTLSS